MADSVDWEHVRKGLERERHRMIWRPYGLPEIVDPERSRFHAGPIQTTWPVPDKISVQTAITGAFFTRTANPAQPISPDEILDHARECVRAGASSIHLHVRDDRGYNALDVGRFKAVIGPLREEFPDLAIDGCYVCALDGEWDQMKKALSERLLDAVPINTAVVYNGDSLFAKPVPVILEKTRLLIEHDTKPIVAVYTDADVSNADRFLFRSGLLDEGQIWCVLPALPGCSPMDNPYQMIDGLLRLVRLVYDTDPKAKIVVCSAGRASSYLVTVAATLGLDIRVGMEDTVWRWPHRDEKLASNLQAFLTAKAIAQALGRDVRTPAEYRQAMGLPAAAPVAAAS
jgi:3-keto-5-aminohexanoate cleavage enzyme